ncbi:hypothetical protein V5O48_002291 [Marasmius crinis-equi]|uniref:[histone H3]-trimethyl-L-lysine(9) demethylase n=1 Tax=Marasmius crinis-equi TaxID=585013 RepID=A0ABR3FWL7_9AGAR
MASSSPTPSLTPSIGSTPPPNIPVQPDHFYDGQPIHATPDSQGKTWLDPDDDRLATRGIPVFKPTMEEFRDFEAYMLRVERWGMNSGIVKVIPPKEWKDSLPPLKEQFSNVQIRTPIEQHMLGQAGLFKQQNFEKRKTMSVREWAEFCAQDEYRAPGIDEVGLHARANVKAKPRRTRKSAAMKADTVEPEMEGQVPVKEEPLDDGVVGMHEHGARAGTADTTPDGDEQKPKAKGRRPAQTKQTKEAKLVERAEKDRDFLETFDPHTHWLPPNTKPEDYTPEFCAKLERQFWRNCGWGKPPWYGADTQGSLYTDETTEWNVAHLDSELSRLLPSEGGLPGVNTPYLYWGMWRATFAWHVEDMDLFSINYIHFGAPKFWYAVPQGRASALEHAMRGFFPKEPTQCHQFLRHKSFLASPTSLAKSACKPNHCVQHSGEFIITYPRGYHAGFNLGFNCAESVNFALASWLELGKVAKACECIPDSVRIDVNKLLEDRDRRERERALSSSSSGSSSSALQAKRKRPSVDAKPISSTSKNVVKREEVTVVIPPLSKVGIGKRKSEGSSEDSPKPKKPKTKPSAQDVSSASSSSKPKPTIKIMPPKITLKLGPRPAEPEVFPCCLCISMSKEGLLRVHDPPINRKDAVEACGYSRDWAWMAHRDCARIVPETWVDEIEGTKEEAVFGVEGIVKDRWNLKCAACMKARPKAHGAPIQCTKGKCPKAFHISCARDVQDNNVVFNIVQEVEKEVVLLNLADTSTSTAPALSHVQALGSSQDQMQVDSQATHPAPGGNGMVVNGETNQDPPSDADVLKVIKKYEVQLLCPQHNPTVAAKKKASKQDRIKNDLLALPPMARIKIRVTAGVFEVTLLRVVEETSSVEVLWDRGSKREFKWGSVVFGNTEGPVQSKPSEVQAAPTPHVPEFQPNTTTAPAYTAPAPPPTYPSLVATTPQPPHHLQPAPSTTTTAYGQYAPTAYAGYPYWTYPAQAQTAYGQTTAPSGYPYGGTFSTPPVVATTVSIPTASASTSTSSPNTTSTPSLHTPTTPSVQTQSQHAPPLYSKFSARPGASTTTSAVKSRPKSQAQPPNVNKYYRNRELQWQTPYQPGSGPDPAQQQQQVRSQTQAYSQPPAVQQQQVQAQPQIQVYPATASQHQHQYQFSIPLVRNVDQEKSKQSQPEPVMDSLQVPPAGATTPSQPVQFTSTTLTTSAPAPTPTPSAAPSASSTTSPPSDLAKILSTLTTDQLTELIQNNPEIRDIVMSAVEKPTSS